MRWPQIVTIVLLALNLGLTIPLHGEEKNGKHNFWLELGSTIFTVLLLYAGGFWG